MSQVAKLSFYVSPQGQDRWSGHLPEPAPDGSDGPFATVKQAQEAVRARPDRSQPVEVLLRGGTYFLKEPLIFGPEDSGITEAPVTYAAYPGELPLLSGGYELNQWQLTEFNGQSTWVADAPDWDFRQLFVEGQRRPRPRLPREGFYHLVGLPGVTEDTPWNEELNEFLVAPGEVKAGKNLSQVEIVMLHKWVESRLPLASVEEETGLVRTARRSVAKPVEGSGELARYYLENVWEALDTPGQWYLDHEAGRVYYLPRPGEEPDTTEVIAPRLPYLVRLVGDPDAGNFVEHLHFYGLTFAHSEWHKPPEVHYWGDKTGEKCGDAQAAVSVPGAIQAEGARYCHLEHCTVAHVSSYGIELSRGCRDNTIARCHIHDLGAGGIKLGTINVEEAEISGHNTVSDCHIHSGGLIYHSAIGLWLGQTGFNTISHNHLHDFFYTGISVGWTWGYGESGAGHNLCEYNHVHHIGQGWLSDMGGIYTLGISPGTVIRHNIFHHIESYDYGGWGIYHDEGSSHIVSEFNLVYGCKSSSFHQHYGRENVLRNNIFALSREAQIARTREEEHLSFVIERNIVYFTQGELFSGNWENGNYRFRRNLYWDTRGTAPQFGDYSWEEWQKRGQDVDSVIAAPDFTAPDQADFSLPLDSPAWTLGFEPFDLSTIGPRGPVGAE